jgi:glycosidase
MIYQIFPERFAIGKPNDLSSKLSQPCYQRSGYVRHARWEEQPTGGNDFFGGDLRGVIDRVGYIRDLGADTVYLTPICTAYSNHKYDTVVYYGEENGMDRGEDPQNRGTMAWAESDWDQVTRRFYQMLIAMRKSRRELIEGKLKMLDEYLEGDAVAFIRYTDVPNQEMLVVVNKSQNHLKQRLMVPHTHFEPKLWFKNLLDPDEHLQFYMGSFMLNLPPESAGIYVPDDGYLLPNGSNGRNYAYFKPRILGSNGP